MKCPNCNQELVNIEKEGLTLDCCPKCHGFWFDAWEWEDLAKIAQIDKSAEIDKINSAKGVFTKEDRKQCPVCSRDMEKIQVGSYVLDRCVADGGIWFDGNELVKFIDTISDDAEVKSVAIYSYLTALKKMNTI